MKRLPVYFVIDISESMAGLPREKLQQALHSVISYLRTDPYALERVHIEIIAFAGKVRVLSPLTELPYFYPPSLPLGSGTAIGAALNFTADEILRNTIRRSPTHAGDYKPIVYFLSDGCATDDIAPALARWQQDIRSRATLISVGIGACADLTPFAAISDEILRLENTDEADFSQFIAWLSQSVSAQSNSIAAGMPITGISLAKAQHYNTLTAINDSTSARPANEKFLIFTGQCTTHNKPYLLKYLRYDAPPSERQNHPDWPAQVYRYNYGCPLTQNYFEWSDSRTPAQTICSEVLLDTPNCPCCQSPYSIALCNCGQIQCVSAHGTPIQCPRCLRINIFKSADNQQGFDLTLSIG